MNPHSSFDRRSGITLLEVMIVMAVLAVLAALLLPALARPRIRSGRISCVNNLKQVGVSVRLWAMDHGDKYPVAVGTNQGGTQGHPAFHQAWPHLTALSNELSTPKILRCPDDDGKIEAQAFDGTVTDANISYFVGLKGQEEKPSMVLGGDRNLTMGGKPLKPGLHVIATNAFLGFTKQMHDRKCNILLPDGSVRQVNEEALRLLIVAQGATNRFAIP